MEFSNSYIIRFALGLCVACALAVSTLYVAVVDRQRANMKLDQRTNVLQVAGVLEPGQKISADEVNAYFENGQVHYVVVERATGEVVEDPSSIEGIDSAELFDPIKWAKDRGVRSDAAVEIPSQYKATQVGLLPRYLQVIEIETDEVSCLVLPIRGYGLWSTLKGFIAVKRDLSEAIGITYYEHGETPGLGGEVDNPAWKAQFDGKQIYDLQGDPKLAVVKAGKVVDPSYQVDGLAGATITTDGVDLMLDLWLGPEGYGPYLKKQQPDV